MQRVAGNVFCRLTWAGSGFAKYLIVKDKNVLAKLSEAKSGIGLSARTHQGEHPSAGYGPGFRCAKSVKIFLRT
jgi:hypothetical protein